MDKIKEAFKSTARAKSIQVITDSFIKVEATATRAARPDSWAIHHLTHRYGLYNQARIFNILFLNR